MDTLKTFEPRIVSRTRQRRNTVRCRRVSDRTILAAIAELQNQKPNPALNRFVKISAIAVRLDLTAETVKNRLAKLAESGHVVLIDSGWWSVAIATPAIAPPP